MNIFRRGWVRRVRRPRLLDVVRIDGHWRVVHQVDSWDGAHTIPLAELLEHDLLVGPELTLHDALVDAGWTPPAE